RAGGGPRAGNIQMQHQRLAGIRIDTIGITGVRQQLAGVTDRPAHGVAVDPVEHIMVVIVGAGLMAENRWRNRPLCRYAATIEKNADVFLVIDGDGYRTAQLARPLAVPANHVIEHVEAGIEHARSYGGLHFYAARPRVRRQMRLTAGTELHHLVETLGTDAGDVVIALHELVPVRNALALQTVDDLVDKRHPFAGVVKQP